MATTLIYDPRKVFCSNPVQIGKTTETFCNLLLDVDNGIKEEVEEIPSNEAEIVEKNMTRCLKKYDKFISPQHFQNVKERCNINQLQTDIDQPVMDVPIHRARRLYVRRKPDADANLNTLRKLHEFETKIPESDANIVVTVDRYLKYRSNVMIEPETYEHDEIMPQTNENVCSLIIRAYLPYKHEVGRRNTRAFPKFDREFKVLSSTTLKDFRDAITCAQDADTGEEKSNDIHKSTSPDNIGPGLFYINGVLYLDERYPYHEGEQYAKNLQEWGNRKGKDIRIHDMNELCFEDIYMRLGYPNVYQHRGCCEHLFLFSDMECLTKESAEKAYDKKYPLITTITKECKMYCHICAKFVATWITLNNKRTVAEEMLWCENCFLRYNYTVDEKRIGTFKAYTFVP